MAPKRTSPLRFSPESSQSKPESITSSPKMGRVSQNSNFETGGVLQKLAQRPGQGESESPKMPRMEITSPEDNVGYQDLALDYCRLTLAVIERRRPPLSQLGAPGPVKDTSPITVPDSECHNFGSLRTEQDVIPGQVWALYDNHDGMPRLYGLITKVCHSPFKVDFSWLEPLRKHRWWVEATALSITCGEFETGEALEVETQSGVLSHVVLERAAPVRGLIEVYPKKGQVWARFSDWDMHQMLGPQQIRTPDGAFDLSYEYDIVQMLDDYSLNTGVTVVTLEKTAGFETIFHPQEGPLSINTIPPDIMNCGSFPTGYQPRPWMVIQFRCLPDLSSSILLLSLCNSRSSMAPRNREFNSVCPRSG